MRSAWTRLTKLEDRIAHRSGCFGTEAERVVAAVRLLMTHELWRELAAFWAEIGGREMVPQVNRYGWELWIEAESLLPIVELIEAGGESRARGLRLAAVRQLAGRRAARGQLVLGHHRADLQKERRVAVAQADEIEQELLARRMGERLVVGETGRTDRTRSHHGATVQQESGQQETGEGRREKSSLGHRGSEDVDL